MGQGFRNFLTCCLLPTGKDKLKVFVFAVTVLKIMSLYIQWLIHLKVRRVVQCLGLGCLGNIWHAEMVLSAVSRGGEVLPYHSPLTISYLFPSVLMVSAQRYLHSFICPLWSSWAFRLMCHVGNTWPIGLSMFLQYLYYLRNKIWICAGTAI